MPNVQFSNALFLRLVSSFINKISALSDLRAPIDSAILFSFGEV